MSEFGDRMRAQRKLLQVVNEVKWQEELLGLSDRAIDRWADRNGVSPESEIAALLRIASEQLRFLANRSQSQVTEDYRRAADQIRTLTVGIESAVGRIKPYPQ